MILNVRVQPRSSRNLVKEENGNLKAYLTKPAEDGLGNAQLIELLAARFKTKKYRIKIIKGFSSRNKLVEISDV